MAQETLPVVTGDKDRSLQEVLTRLTASRGPVAVGRAIPSSRRRAGCRRWPRPSRRFRKGPTSGCARRSRRAGIEQLYTHQAEAFEHVLAGRNVVTITPTASGKTLCYNAPVLERDPEGSVDARAVPVPDQGAGAGPARRAARAVRAGDARHGDAEIGVFTYDGDTPSDARRAIRGKAHVVLSNPDMLHSGILPHHPRWAKLFENLKFVVIDELHAYRGVFGSHLANILRRLQRICRHYGSDPIFICSSATIANPRELAEGLTGRPFELVEQSGAPRGEKFFLFVNPPVVNAQLGIRRSYLAEARRVALEFLKHNLQLILFAQSRLATEILTTYLKDAFHGPPGAADVIRGYRGGYLPNRRREIERGLREGAGARRRLDQRARARHRHRRARRVGDGRLSRARSPRPGSAPAAPAAASTRSAAVLVASSAPIDQFIVRNPSYFFDASPEHALINPDNLHILLDHVKCAAFELPFTRRRARSAPGDERAGDSVGAGGGGVRPPGRRPVELDARIVSGRRGQPAVGVVRQLRRRRHHAAASASSARPTSPAARRRCTRRRSTSSKGSCSRSSASTSTAARPIVRAVDCDYYTDAITYTKVTILDTFAVGRFEVDDRASAAMADGAQARRRRAPSADLPDHAASRLAAASRDRTAKSTSSPASSASRRSSSTRTRTSAPASSICPSSRCTPRPTG